MIEQLSMPIPEDTKKEPEKKPNPVWAKINAIDEKLGNIVHRLEVIEKSLRRSK